MEVGEMDKKEPQVEVPCVPTTPAKPILTKPEPICMPEAQNHQPGHQHASEAIACFEFSAGVVPATDESVPAATLTKIAGKNGKTCEHGASDNVSSWSNIKFSELLFLAEAASKNSGGMVPENNDGLKNPFIPSLNSQFNGDLQGTSYIPCCTNKTSQDTLHTPDNAIIAESRQIASMQINVEVKEPWGEEENVPTKELDNNGTPPNKELCDLVTDLAAASASFKENHEPDNGSSHDIDLTKTPQPKRRRSKHRPKVIIEGKPKRTRKSATPKPFQSKENPTVKRSYVRRKGANKTSTPPTELTGELTKEIMPESAKVTCRRSLNFEIGARDEGSAGRENATAHLDKEIGVVVQETNVCLGHDLNTSTKLASNNYIVISDDSESPSTSPLSRNRLRAKPKEKPTGKRRRPRKKGLNKTSSPTTEVTGESSKEMMPKYAKTSSRRSLNLGIEARDESSAGIENENVHVGKEIGVAVQETNIGLPNLKISVKRASNNYMSLSEDKQAPITAPSKSNPPEAKAIENATGKRQYVRRKSLNKSTTPPTEMTAALTEPKMPDSTKMSHRISAGRESLNEHISKGHNSMKQALSSYMSLPEDAHAQSTSPAKSNPLTAKKNEKATGKRRYVRKKGMNKSSTPPSEMTAELTRPMMPESTKMARRRSLNFDGDTRDESSAGRQSLHLYNSKENSLVAEETHVGLACSQSTPMKQALYSFMSLPEDKQAPSTSPMKSNHPGAKLNANSVEDKSKRYDQATAQDGHENSAKLLLKSVGRSNSNGSNISNNQTSMKRIQIVGPKRKHSGTIEHADTSSMNEIGAHYNEFPSYQPKFMVQFPNIHKKRRSDKGKSSNTSITSSVTTTEEVELTCPQEVAQVLPYASGSSSWSFGSEYITARVPTIKEATKNENLRIPNPQRFLIDDPQEYEDFILNLRRVTERSSLPTQICDFTSLTRIRNLGTEPNYSVNQLCISEMQQHQNFALGGYHLSLGKSSLDIACEVRWQIMQHVNALSEQFSQLDINKEVRDLAFHEQNALVLYKQQNKKQSRLVNGDGTVVPFQGSFDPIKKQLPRPKVDIDMETDRVWKLLMLDINSHGIDGTDEDKAKWWEEERNVFRGRADSFIARMHLVQGDRRFSPWKGSVLDSVVGVFLTQNVSDHLSSSAFMSLAARFPRKSNSVCKTYHGEGSSLVAKEPQVHIVEPEENTEWDVKILNQSVYDQSSMTMDIGEHSGEKEAANSSCRTTSSLISLTNESNCRLSESSQRNIGEHHSPVRSGLISVMNEEGEEKSCYEGVRKEFNDIVSSQCSVISSQISGDFSNDQNPEKIGSCSDSNSEVEDLSSTAKYHSFYDNSTSFSKLLEMASSTKLHEVNSQSSKSTENLRHAYGQSVGMKHDHSTENLEKSNVTEGSLEASIILSHPIHKDAARNETNEISSAPIKLKSKGQGKEKKDDINWDSLRIQAQAKAGKREKTEDTMDSLDWDAVRCADVNEIANTIKERGMNNRLAERIKNFLNRLVEEHGDIDLEWLRDVPPDQAKEYLLSVRGLGLKSVECVRLLTLHHLAFPVDTNVGRIAVRLGWVPLQPLPESLQLHLLELYPILESIQKYLWPRLCKLDQRTLYELHYQMITFGKVFCTKSKPNCNACPMRGECRHFASAFASARLALPGPEQKSIVSTSGNNVTDQNPSVSISQLHLPPPENTNQAEEIQQTEVGRQLESKSETNICQPIIEEPTTPEPECSQLSQNDIEDAFYEDVCEIPTIKLNMEEFTLNVQNYLQANMELQEGEMSKALVALNPEAASIPMPKLKNVSRLRTEHCVYELPDTHPLLEGWDMRELDDPGKYLLAIWTPGETANSIQPPESKCSSQECGQLCNEKECFACNSFREANSQIVRGTLLIPCKTAMRGSFPLNGTYFQVNEVFADHDSSLNPISVPRSWLWNLNRRTVYFGTSIPTIFKGLSTQEIQQCFWRGYVCVRGFDKETRAPRPLMARLHFPASKMPKTQEKTRKRSTPANTQGLEPNPEQPELIPELISDGHNLKETGSELAKTKEKKRKRSTPTKAKGLKSNPEHLELISDGHNLQETGSKNAKPRRRPRKKSTPADPQGLEPNPEHPVLTAMTQGWEPNPEHPVLMANTQGLEPSPEHPVLMANTQGLEPNSEHPILMANTQGLEPNLEHPMLMANTQGLEPNSEHPLLISFDRNTRETGNA